MSTKIIESSSTSCIQPKKLFDEEESMQIPQFAPEVMIPVCEPEGHFGNKIIVDPASDRRSLSMNMRNPEQDLNLDQLPEIQCKCGAGKCLVLTSRTERNPNRRFYRCPLSQSQRCKYFQWCDELGQASQSPLKPRFKSPIIIESSKNTPLNSDDPICRCKAGTCTILTMPDGKDKGRKYYACFIKKGHGACDHFEWVDEQTKIPETDNNNNNNNNNNLNENDILISNATTQDPNQSSPPYESIKDLFSENDMNTIDFWHNDQNAPDKVRTGETEGSKESSPVKRDYKHNDSYSIGETSPMKRLNLNDEQNGGVACNLREISPNVGTNLQNGLKRSGKCFICQKEGHWAVDCIGINGRV